MLGFLEEYVARPIFTFFGLYTPAVLPVDEIALSARDNIGRATGNIEANTIEITRLEGLIAEARRGIIEATQSRIAPKNYLNGIENGLSVEDACSGNYICEGFEEIGGDYDYETMALLGLGIGLLAVSSAAVYWYLKDDEHCQLTGKENGQNQAKEDFLKTFKDILDKYKDVEGALPEKEQAHLKETLKSLFKFYFWRKPTVPADMDMRIGLSRKLSLMYHPDKPRQDSTQVTFNKLMGTTDKDYIFKTMNEVRDRKPHKSDNPENYQADKAFLKAIPNLSTALKTHKARNINALSGKKM